MAAPRPILIVEDDAALRATLAEQIMLAVEFRTVEAGSAAEAAAKPKRRRAPAKRPDGEGGDDEGGTPS